MIRKTILTLTVALLPLISAASSTPQQFTFYTIDNSNGSTVLTGINNLGKVVGYWSKNGINTAVTSEAPYAGWSQINYPGAISSVAAALSNTRIQVGYYQTLNSTAGYVRNQGIYTSADSNGTAYLGTNHIQCFVQTPSCHGHHVPNPDPLVVGYQSAPNTSTSNPITQATEWDLTTKAVTLFTPPGAVSSEATGINGHGYIVGSLKTTNSVTESWIYRKGIYHILNYPSAHSTTARALNWQDEVVGDYQDTNNVTHGFFVSQPTGINPMWKSIDYPGATSTTVHSINDHDDMVGSYIDSSGIVHGFLAVPQVPVP